MASAAVYSSSTAASLFCSSLAKDLSQSTGRSNSTACTRSWRQPGKLSLENSFLPSRQISLPQPLVRSSPSNRSAPVVALHEGTSGQFREDDEAFATATILECSEVRSGREGFLIKMTDGRQVTCRHASSQGTQLPVSKPQPAMVLRLEDDSGIMLPIIVLEQPVQLLMECLRNIPLTRPTAYQVMKDMVGIMGYELKLVRITHRVCEAYYARAYLCKIGGGLETVVSLDMRPSDAINLAARAKVPIQVNKALALGDGVVPISVTSGSAEPKPRLGYTLTDADRPLSGPCLEAEEFALVRAVTVAAMLERYGEAARLRDALFRFRALRGALEHELAEKPPQIRVLEQEQP